MVNFIDNIFKIGKKEFMVEQFGPQTLSTMMLIKKSLDPNSILNPGKKFPN
jgi:FAD/FMN-containing dehydrogenase